MSCNNYCVSVFVILVGFPLLLSSQILRVDISIVFVLAIISSSLHPILVLVLALSAIVIRQYRMYK